METGCAKGETTSDRNLPVTFWFLQCFCFVVVFFFSSKLYIKKKNHSHYTQRPSASTELPVTVRECVCAVNSSLERANELFWVCLLCDFVSGVSQQTAHFTNVIINLCERSEGVAGSRDDADVSPKAEVYAGVKNQPDLWGQTTLRYLDSPMNPETLPWKWVFSPL